MNIFFCVVRKNFVFCVIFDKIAEKWMCILCEKIKKSVDIPEKPI